MSEDEHNFYYRAQTPFFSIFAIADVTKSQQSKKFTLSLPKELQEEKVHKVEEETPMVTIQSQEETKEGEFYLYNFLLF